jgi:HemY protein
MKLRHLFLLATIVGALLAWLIKEQHGFVLIAWDNHTLEMRLWIAATLLLLLLLSVFVASWLLFMLRRSGKYLSLWSRSRGNRKARNQTLAGIVALAEGHWTQAEQLLNKAIERSDTPLINYLLAAKAAQEQHNFAQRDLYLKQASDIAPEASVAVSVTQAELQFEGKQYEQALATVTQLWEDHQRHPYVLKLLAKCYFQLKDWGRLYNLLQQLKKTRVFPREDYQQLEHHCITQWLISEAQQGAEQLLQLWQALHKDYQKQLEFVRVYAQLLVELNAHADAEAVLRQALKRQYHRDLIYWYGHAAGRDSQTQLHFAESFKNDGQTDWQLYFALGQLSYHNQLWGKARDYLMQSIKLCASLEAYQLLVLTLEHLNEPLDAINHTLKSALMSASTQNRPMLLTNRHAQLLSNELTGTP